MNHPFNVRSFFPINGNGLGNDNRQAVGYGFELIRGYFQSVRPAIGKILLNIDISTGLFFKPGRLIDVAFDFFNRPGSNPTMLSPQGGLDARKRLQLQRFLTGVRVTVAPTNKIVTINRLTEVGADAYRFKLREGEELSVAEYFRRQQNRPLDHPRVICILVCSPSLIRDFIDQGRDLPDFQGCRDPL